jgi:hypothetical protein
MSARVVPGNRIERDGGVYVSIPTVTMDRADYDRMVEREREAREFMTKTLPPLVHGNGHVGSDHTKCQAPACKAVRAFLAETKETSDGK